MPKIIALPEHRLPLFTYQRVGEAVVWETTISIARKRRLAPPQVVADNYPQSAHDVDERSRQPMRSNRIRMSEEVDWEGMRLSKMSGICPVYTRGVPLPPLIYFQNLADYMNHHGINRFRNSSGRYIPHREIRPSEITEKIRFIAENCPEKIFCRFPLVRKLHSEPECAGGSGKSPPPCPNLEP
jgi:hypothetical protein